MNIKKIFEYVPPKEYNFTLSSSPTFDLNTQIIEKQIYSNLDLNLNCLKSLYSISINSDILIRKFSLTFNYKIINAFIVYIDGLSDSKLINQFILNPLMLENSSSKLNLYANMEEYIFNNLIPQNNVKKLTNFKDIVISINSGNCILFIDTLDICFDIDVKGFKQRSIDAPNNEVIINGPQEAFVENLRTNTSLLRRIINNENLIIENLSIGTVTHTSIALCYMKNIANTALINEAKYRISNIELDSLLSSGQLSQLLQENDHLDIPTMLETERPDKCAKFLMQGRIVIIINGNPYALVAPIVLIDFLSSPEDTNLKSLFANFLKIIRIFAYAITLLAPGVFVAITDFHHEILPTELLFSILASRQYVPFPIIFELLIMEFSFELIRESGLRVPSPIGGTLGIVGALILGDAAVSAHLVSPILIIVVAITGLSSFAIPDFAFSFHLRVYRFLFILLGYGTGFLGISAGLLIYINVICSIKSFGVNFASPLTHPIGSYVDGFFVRPAWKDELRKNYLAPKKKVSQPPISKKWKK